MKRNRNVIASFLILSGIGLSVGAPIHKVHAATVTGENQPPRVEEGNEHRFSRPPVGTVPPRPEVNLKLDVLHERPLHHESEKEVQAYEIKNSVESIDRTNNSSSSK